MGRKTHYTFQKRQREIRKAEKKAEKARAKAEKAERSGAEQEDLDTFEDGDEPEAAPVEHAAEL